MIVFSLTCEHHHVFEAWFPSGAAYEAQVADGVVACPLCGSADIRKAPMAPRVARHRDGADAGPAETTAAPSSDDAPTPAPGGPPPGEVLAPPKGPEAAAWRRLAALCRLVEGQTDNVGPRFAEEARRIHYGETEPRSIRGEASDDEAEALTEEGIRFTRLPWIPPGRH